MNGAAVLNGDSILWNACNSRGLSQHTHAYTFPQWQLFVHQLIKNRTHSFSIYDKGTFAFDIKSVE